MKNDAASPTSPTSYPQLINTTAHLTELLAVYCAIRHFQHFLEARVLTDHKPLTHSFNSKPDRHSPRQVRQLDFISQFTTDIHHCLVWKLMYN